MTTVGVWSRVMTTVGAVRNRVTTTVAGVASRVTTTVVTTRRATTTGAAGDPGKAVRGTFMAL